jgi:hypothetical protein
MKNPVVVIETEMYDGVDLIHTWYNIDDAKESGRFDFLVDNGDITLKRFQSIKKISTLVNLSGCFYLAD